MTTNQDYAYSHGLGITYFVGSIWFSNSSDGSGRLHGPMPLSWREHNPERTDGVCLAKADVNSITIRTGNQFRIPASAPGPDAHDVISSGYARVVLVAAD